MAGPATAGLKLASDATYLHAKTEELTAAIDASRFVIQALELESGALASSIKGKWNEEYLVFMRWTHGLLLGSSCTTDFCGGNVYFFCLWKIYIHTPFVTKQKTEREWKMPQLSFVHLIRCPIDVICWKLNSRCRAVKWVQRDGLSNYKLHQKYKKKPTTSWVVFFHLKRKGENIKSFSWQSLKKWSLKPISFSLWKLETDNAQIVTENKYIA